MQEQLAPNSFQILNQVAFVAHCAVTYDRRGRTRACSRPPSAREIIAISALSDAARLGGG
jgi:hypothetical protein